MTTDNELTRRVTKLATAADEARQYTANVDLAQIGQVEYGNRLARLKQRGARVDARRTHDAEQETRQRAHEASSAYRAGVVRRLRRRSLQAGIPGILAMGAWSTAGVHQYLAIGTTPGSVTDMLAWTVEPVIIAIVAGIIVVRSLLAIAGGKLPGYLYVIEFGALAASIAMNAAGAAYAGQSVRAHLVGPVGAAVIALVMVGLDSACRGADIDTGPANSPANSGLDVFAAATSEAANTLFANTANRLANRVNGDPANSANGSANSSLDVFADSGEQHQAEAVWTDNDDAQLQHVLDSKEPPLYPSPANTTAANGSTVREAREQQPRTAAANSGDGGPANTSRTPLTTYVDRAREQFTNRELPGPRQIANTVGCSPSTAAKVARLLKGERAGE